MKKFIAILFIVTGFVLTSCKSSILLGKAVGELATVPLGITVGACEGFAEGCCEGADYLINGDTTTVTTYRTTTYSGSTSAPVYVLPSERQDKTSIVVNNSENVNVNITEVNSSSTTTRTPTVIYVPSRRPNYYYYNPYQFNWP